MTQKRRGQGHVAWAIDVRAVLVSSSQNGTGSPPAFRLSLGGEDRTKGSEQTPTVEQALDETEQWAE